MTMSLRLYQICCYAALLLLYFYYAVRREKIDLRALVRSAMHRGINNNER